MLRPHPASLTDWWFESTPPSAFLAVVVVVVVALLDLAGGAADSVRIPDIAYYIVAQPLFSSFPSSDDITQGKAQLVSNINACQAVADAVRTTLGPRGMDKLIFDGRKVTISNDGATIMKLLEIAHPAAKTLVDISMSQVREPESATQATRIF